MNFLFGLFPALAPYRLFVQIGIALALVASLSAVYFGWRGHQRDIGRDEIRVQWNAERQALKDEVQKQRDRNLELQRAAEKKYTVVAQVRDHFMTQIVTEVRDATQPLAVCPVGPAAVRLLNSASHCAGEDRPASCGAGDGVQSAQ